MRQLVIGRGQIGSALVEVLGCDSYDQADNKLIERDAEYDVLHIAYPYSHRFAVDLRHYQELYKATLIIVYSTVPVGTCEPNGWVHSPVEGRHPDLAESLTLFPRFIGSRLQIKRTLTAQIWEPYTETIQLGSADQTEFLKLRSTARYGINLAFADYEKSVADELEMDWQYLKWYDQAYNDLYDDMNMDWAKRYVLDPPQGFIGGHCVVPNAEILNEQYPNTMLETIIGMGE